MTRLRIFIIIVGSIILINFIIDFGFPPIAEYIDSKRFEAFDERCKEAHERVYATLKVDEIALEYLPSGNIHNDTYEADVLIHQLMKPQQIPKTVQMLYELNDHVSCVGSYVDIVTNLNSLPKASRCRDLIRSSTIPRARVLVRIKRGNLNSDIHPIQFQIIDTLNNKILAEHSTFELLLGNMLSTKNRRWYGWGTAQAAISCNLPPPKNLIGRVIESPFY